MTSYKELQQKIREGKDKDEEEVEHGIIFQPYILTFKTDEILKMVDDCGKQMTIKRIAGKEFQESYIALMLDDLLSK